MKKEPWHTVRRKMRHPPSLCNIQKATLQWFFCGLVQAPCPALKVLFLYRSFVLGLERDSLSLKTIIQREIFKTKTE